MSKDDMFINSNILQAAGMCFNSKTQLYMAAYRYGLIIKLWCFIIIY